MNMTNDRDLTMEDQVEQVAEMPPQQLHEELEKVWRGDEMPAAAVALTREGVDGPRRLAHALWTYWLFAVEPHWRSIRAVLDEDVVHRAAELTKRGLNGMIGSLHETVSVQDGLLQIEKLKVECDSASSAALVLSPSVFAWPSVTFGTSNGSINLTYPARGVGVLWQSDGILSTEDDSLGALFGRGRAAILVCLALPHSTTELSLKLGQSPPAVSQHLSVLRRSGLVTSWRSGRSVIYGRTALATSIVEVGGRLSGSGGKESD
jgi:DNA-binding transcriptional ArsR family regulator